MKKIFLVILVVLVALGLLGKYSYDFAVYRVLPYSAIRPHRLSGLEKKLFFPYATDLSKLDLQIEPFDVRVEDSIMLKGYFIRAITHDPLGTIILLHGIASCKEAMLPFADTLSHHGYNCIVYDSRANGESGGINCTFGYYEKHDVSTYIDQAYNRFSKVGPIGIFGSSMGAAVAIQAMAIDRRISCGIVESPFSTMREVIYQFWKEMFFLPIRSIPNKALAISEQIAHFKVDSVSPEQSARLISQPVMVVHGDRDEKIPADESKSVFDCLESPQKEWFSIAGGHHNDLSHVGGSSYLNAELDFFRTHLK